MIKIDKIKDWTLNLFALSIITRVISIEFDYKILHIIDNLVFATSLISLLILSILIIKK